MIGIVDMVGAGMFGISMFGIIGADVGGGGGAGPAVALKGPAFEQGLDQSMHPLPSQWQ
ncbi:hypothetical protein [Bradyrhizobium lablabi]|nr:hypothetical protein [Bradyrhizobium lablabi]